MLQPLDRIFNDSWKQNVRDGELRYAIGSDKYRTEVNKWLIFFESKGWLDTRLKRKLRSAKTWPSYYSKVNELRAGYFFETKLNFSLTDHEFQTSKDRKVDFKGTKNKSDFFIEVKTPLDLDRRKYQGGSYNNSDKVYFLLDKALPQLPDDGKNIVVLSDDLKVPLLSDPLLKFNNTVETYFNSPESEKIGAVCVLGDIYHETMYKLDVTLNPNAKNPIDKIIFENS